MAETASTSSFSRFAELPYELRAQIWTYSLPTDLECPRIFAYKKGCWKGGRFSEDHELYDHQHPQYNDFDKLDHEELYIDYQVALSFVSSEAREIAVDWAQRVVSKGIRLSSVKGGQVLRRMFDPDCDALYLHSGTVKQFFDDLWEVAETLDIHSTYSHIRNLAMWPESTDGVERDWHDMCVTCGTFNTALYIVNPPPPSSEALSYPYQDISGVEYQYNHASRQFDKSGANEASTEELRNSLKAFADILGPQVAQHSYDCKIRPILVDWAHQ